MLHEPVSARFARVWASRWSLGLASSPKTLRDHVNTELPNYFSDDEVDEGSDDELDEDLMNNGVIALFEQPLAGNLINPYLPD
jgi:hypothetical protein